MHKLCKPEPHVGDVKPDPVPPRFGWVARRLQTGNLWPETRQYIMEEFCSAEVRADMYEVIAVLEKPRRLESIHPGSVLES